MEDKKTSRLEKKNKVRKEPFITTVSSGRSDNVKKGDLKKFRFFLSLFRVFLDELQNI